MTSNPNDRVDIQTLIQAPVQLVWNAWTDPALILQWFGSDPLGKGLNAVVDLRPGGKFEISFVNADGTKHSCHGLYSEVVELQKLSFSWEWQSEPGVESFVMIILQPEDRFTRMFFTHANLGTGSAHDYLPGWKSTFDKLEKLIGMNK